MLRTRFWKKGLLLAVAAILAVSLTACGKSEVVANYKLDDSADAKTGTVTQKEFDQYIAFYSNIMNPQMGMLLDSIPEAKEQLLNEYIGYKILYARLGDDSADVKKAKEDANNFYDQVKSQLIDQQDTVKKAFDDAGLDEKMIKNIFATISATQANQNGLVKDADVQAQYDKSKDDYNVITVRHILIMTTDPQTGEAKLTDDEALKKAQEVKAKLDAGGDWNALAKEYSDDTGSKDNGGLYENQEAKVWVDEFKQAANTQEIGKIGDPVKSSYGYHVMKVEKREPTPFDKLSADDKNELTQIVASDNLNKFMTDDLPKLITSTNLPSPSPEPSASPDAGASASPDASASPSPDASASPSPDAGAAQ